MFKTKRNIVLGLAVCALLLPATASVKNPVERPYKSHGEGTVIVDLEDFILHGNPVLPWWIDEESGEATHLGLYTNTGEGTHNLITGEVMGSGYSTAANGDILFWQMTRHGEDPAVVTWTGGTGRFEGASGSIIDPLTEESAVQVGYLRILTLSRSGIGTITY